MLIGLPSAPPSVAFAEDVAASLDLLHHHAADRVTRAEGADDAIVACGKVGTVEYTESAKAFFFPVGVPNLFRQYNAPADFVETANTIGLPRYAKQAVDQEFGRWVKLHTQSNPLPICTRPKVLIKAKRT